MGSTLAVIRSLLENQIDSGETDATSDPTSTVLNTYINKAIRKIVFKDKPRELYSPTVSTVAIVANQNTVTIPSTLILPDLVYYTYSSGTVLEVLQKSLKEMIELESAKRFFDTTNTGDPSLYDIKGTSILFNKYFSRSEADAIKIYGLAFPTTLTNDTDVTELTVDYDLLIVYEACVLFYQKDDDLENQRKFETLAFQERADLRTFLRTNDSSAIQLDPYTFTGNYGSPKTDNGIFFGG